MQNRRPRPRQQSTVARAERKGAVVCPDVLVVVQGRPGGLGTDPRDDMTAWFYGALERHLEEDLDELAHAARNGQPLPEAEVNVDLILRTPGGELRLDGCHIGLPVRYAGPASTLQYRLSHPGTVAAPAKLTLVA
jgi:hypothetical protein